MIIENFLMCYYIKRQNKIFLIFKKITKHYKKILYNLTKNSIYNFLFYNLTKKNSIYNFQKI